MKQNKLCAAFQLLAAYPCTIFETCIVCINVFWLENNMIFTGQFFSSSDCALLL